MLRTPDYHSVPAAEIRILLLGPGERFPQEHAKRRAIRQALIDKGFAGARLGEEVINPDTQLPLHMELARLVLRGDFDLILVLDAGPAPLVELTTLSTTRSALGITEVWWKREFRSEGRSTPAEVVAVFHNHPYSADEFNVCDLTAEFIQAAWRLRYHRAMALSEQQGTSSGELEGHDVEP